MTMMKKRIVAVLVTGIVLASSGLASELGNQEKKTGEMSRMSEYAPGSITCNFESGRRAKAVVSGETTRDSKSTRSGRAR